MAKESGNKLEEMKIGVKRSGKEAEKEWRRSIAEEERTDKNLVIKPKQV